MAVTTASTEGIQRRAHPKRPLRNDLLPALLLGGPAFLLLLVFLIGPFFMGILFSFTDQRLVSPNPAQFVGTRNYERLLGVSLLTLDPIVDPQTGQPQRDAQGQSPVSALARLHARRAKVPAVRGAARVVQRRSSAPAATSCWPPTRRSCTGCGTTSSSPWSSSRCRPGWACCWRCWSTSGCAGATSSAPPITARW